MKISLKKKAGQQPQTKLEKRISSISTPELVVWAENSLAAIGKNVYHHQRDGVDALYEAEIGAEALLAITRELIKRANNEF
jgi:hypothetical protein